MLKIIEKLGHDHHAVVDDELMLCFDDRKKGRLKTMTNANREVGLFLERGEPLRNGTLLKAETGETIRLLSAPESVITAYTSDLLVLAKICYHLGNRHVPLQIGEGWLRFQPDHVLEDLVKLFGLTVEHEQAPFEPESGAYSHHGHNH